MKSVDIYTDGACSGNPGPGGWGAVLIYGGKEKEISGSAPNATNQRMELTAAAEALNALKEPCRARVHSDSAYLVNAFNQNWIDNWQKNGWRTAKGSPVENQDLWQQLVKLSAVHDVEWIKVRGHAGNTYNERCDQLARDAIGEAVNQ